MSEKEKQDDYRVDIGDVKRPYSPQRGPSSPSSAPIVSGPTLAILSYCGASILMTLTNKYVLSGYDFNLNFMLLAIQNIICVVAIQSGKVMGQITFRDFKADEARKWFPISLLLISMIYTGSKAIQFLSVPVYTIFKNLTIILIAYGEVLWFGGSVTHMTLFSFGLMVLSSIVAAWADINAAISSYGHNSSETATALSTLNAGYIWMLANCLSSAAYVLGMRKRIKLTNFKDFDTMFYNNLLSIPVIILCSLFLEDWSQANIDKNFPPALRTNLMIAIVFSGLSSVFISYTSAWCVRVTSSTTYSMVGALNKLPIALSGLVFFDAPVTFPSVSAIGLGFVSGIVYAMAKVKQQKAKTTTLPITAQPISASSLSMRDGLKS
jgi:GDP-mannose transporter